MKKVRIADEVVSDGSLACIEMIASRTTRSPASFRFAKCPSTSVVDDMLRSGADAPG